MTEIRANAKSARRCARRFTARFTRKAILSRNNNAHGRLAIQAREPVGSSSRYLSLAPPPR